MSIVILVIALMTAYCAFAHWISYRFLKNRIIAHRHWDLNICCGRTDGGGVNADIVRHADLPRFVPVGDIYRLPFATGEFETVLCSHTMEHVDDPDAFFAELERVGRRVTIVLPPLYDIAAVLNVFEHKWIFLSFRKVHASLPPRIRLPMSGFIQRTFGQVKRG